MSYIATSFFLFLIRFYARDVWIDQNVYHSLFLNIDPPFSSRDFLCKRRSDAMCVCTCSCVCGGRIIDFCGSDRKIKKKNLQFGIHTTSRGDQRIKMIY
jgi:hypothetical protein